MITAGEMRFAMFSSYQPFDLEEYQGEVNVGDLLKIKEGMMLMDPMGPVIVLEANNSKGIYEIMYTRNNYVVSCGRIEIEEVISRA